MTAPDTSVGRMIAYAVDRIARTTAERPAPGLRSSRPEAMARRMLEYVLAVPRSRRAFVKHVADTSGTALAFRSATRTGPALDLTAEIDGTDARIGIITRVEEDIAEGVLAQRLAELVDSPASRLVVITPKGRKPDEDPEDARLVAITWPKLAKRLTDKDDRAASLWAALAEYGEAAGARPVDVPVSPRILLDEDTVAAFRAHLDTLRLSSTTLLGLPARFSRARPTHGAWLQAGAGGDRLGIEFGPVELGTPVWLAGSRPARTANLGIGALTDDDAREAAEKRLHTIAAGESWRDGDEHLPAVDGFLGAPADARVEDARALLWEVFDPERLEAAGFPMAIRSQPDLDELRLAVRLRYPADPRGGTFLVAIGGARTWRTLLPRVTREYDDKTYVVQAEKSDTADDLVRKVHEALTSLATKP
ncbi:hypothetical protein ACT3TZ_07775 [Brachybacterium sp. AOP25-B2-12]|uniref:hypothetical protein n=1 Tax=Brachybacterium sp. AOP25-B2-12 TaxID=3457710 RepID=UPI0040334D9C